MSYFRAYRLDLLLLGAWCLLIATCRATAVMPLAAIDPILHGCSDDDAAHVLQAWREAGDLARAHYEWSPGGTWQEAMDLYLGNATRKDYDFWGDPGPLVGQNIVRDWLVHFAGYGSHPRNTYAWIYCHQEDVPGFDPRYPSCLEDTYAATWDHLGWWWSAHYVILCPYWWNFTVTSSLAELTLKADGDINFQMGLDYWLSNRAHVLHHETYHWSETVSVPRCRDYTYNPQSVCNIAYYYGTQKARLNAESYAQAALAIYIQKTFHLDSPPTPYGVPYLPTPDDPNASSDNGSGDGFSGVPSDWVSPVSIDSENFTWWDVPGATALSSYGNTTQPDDRDCQLGQQFFNFTQCRSFCDPGICQETSSQPKWWKCVLCTAPRTCRNGEYLSTFSCDKNCDGGNCKIQAATKNVTCSGCPNPGTCKPGTYANFVDCAQECGGGLCSTDGKVGAICSC